MRHTCADRRAGLHVSPCRVNACAQQALVIDVSTYYYMVCARIARLVEAKMCRFGTPCADRIRLSSKEIRQSRHVFATQESVPICADAVQVMPQVLPHGKLHPAESPEKRGARDENPAASLSLPCRCVSRSHCAALLLPRR